MRILVSGLQKLAKNYKEKNASEHSAHKTQNKEKKDELTLVKAYLLYVRDTNDK